MRNQHEKPKRRDRKITRELLEENQRLYSALEEIAYRNSVHNDKEAYDLALARWGMGIKATRPVATDYGQVEVDAATVASHIAKIMDECP